MRAWNWYLWLPWHRVLIILHPDYRLRLCFRYKKWEWIDTSIIGAARFLYPGKTRIRGIR